MNHRSRITDWLLLIAVPAFFFLWKLSAFGLVGADEPRYAQVAREMLTRHDWVTPTLGGKPWLEKPPLYYWQAIIAYKMFGVSDWAARLPSVVDAFLLVIATYLMVRRIRPGIELDGAVILGTSAGVVGFARAASMDMPLTAMFGVAMLAWYAWSETAQRKYLAAAYVFVSLAMLAKGPVAPFLAIVTIGLSTALNRNLQLARQTLWIPGIVLFCAITLPWYVLVQFRNPQFFHEFIIEHNLARFGTNLYRHPEPFWYYVPVTLLGWLPWTALVVFSLWLFSVKLSGICGQRFKTPITESTELHRDTSQRMCVQDNPAAERFHAFLLIWIFVIVVFFSISQSKLPGYILPAIPAGAILCAEYSLSMLPNKAKRLRILIAGMHAFLAAALVFCALNVQSLVLQHKALWNRSVPILAAIVVGAIVAGLLIQSRFRALRLATLAPVIIALALAVRFGSQPLDEQLSARPVANELANFETHQLPVAVFLVPREVEFGLAFYRNRVIPRYEFGQVPLGEHLVIAAQGYPEGVAKLAGRQVKYLGNFAPQRLDLFYVPAH